MVPDAHRSRLTALHEDGPDPVRSIPEVVRGINAFTIAMRKVNPEATVKVVWVNSWYDPGKEADAAKALIDQGVDIITQHTDSPAPLQVLARARLVFFGDNEQT